MSGNTASRGIITIAQGKQQYIDMAKKLAISLNYSNPGLKKALATDSKDPELKELYDEIIPTDNSLGIGIIQKLYMYDYSPFDETIFIDVDCLVVKNIDFLWKLFSGNNVGVMGRKVFDGELFGVPVKQLGEKLGLSYIPAFNGGTYYFKKNPRAKAVYDKAKELVSRYDELGIARHRGNINEEPLMSIALGLFNEEPVNDDGMGMYTPVGQSGVFKMDVLKGYCEFYKYGKKVTPAIMHFGLGHTQAFHYKREVLKLDLVYYKKIPAGLVSASVNFLYNPLYVAYVLAYRTAKSLLKGEKFKMSPLMPMFRFE